VNQEIKCCSVSNPLIFSN